MRPPTGLPPQALLITGTVGAGKTSVAEAVGDLLTEAKVPNAVIDLDWLRRSWPPPSGDRFNLEMELRNLTVVARNYLQSGIVRLVLAGVVESRMDRQRYRDAVGVDLAVCRLRVALTTIRERLLRRHTIDDLARRWHLERAPELDGILEEARVEDFTVSARERSVTGVATAVVRAAGWG